MKRALSKVTERQLFWAGLILMLLAQVPYLILNENSIVPYHDQLDGEIIAYIYQAKYLFSGQTVIPEFLGGAPATSLVPPAPLAVLLFRFLSPFHAYFILQVMGQLTAYVGMFRLAELLTGKGPAALAAALLYAFLPFLPVYGLSQYGIPLLLVCIYKLYKGRSRAAMAYIAFYSAMSSLTLCGFAWLMLGGIGILALAVCGRWRAHKPVVWGYGLMFGIYLAENISLIAQLLGLGESFISHKSEYVLHGESFIISFWEFLRYNAEHSRDNHLWILYLAVIILMMAIVKALYRRIKTGGQAGKNLRIFQEETMQGCKWLALDMAAICFLCLIAALWESNVGVGIRVRLGTLGAFQMDRVLWLTPALWYAGLALILSILWNGSVCVRWLGYGVSFLMLGGMGIGGLKNSMVKPCVQEILIADYETISWADYLALGVMEQVEAFIEENENRSKESYRVASLGIDPAAALYHGFYCVDGYSNNYSLEYKHRFRKVIAPELERSEWLRDYYDQWGNRCYLVCAEIPGYYNIEKGTAWYNSLQIDTAALKDLGCDYILSAAYIVNAEEENLTLLNENALETQESYYRIYIYRIEE